MTEAWENTMSFVQDLGESARRNPISAALIGMGVFWLFGGRAVQAAGAIVGRIAQDGNPADAAPYATSSGLRTSNARTGMRSVADATGSSVKTGVRSVADNVASASSRFQDGAASAMQESLRYGREQADTVAQYARSVPETGTQMIDSFRSSLTDVLERQPLALGAIGLAIGAGIAAALPPTELEAEYLGETSETVKEKATQFAAEKAARAKEVAEEALTAAAEEARNQGLTVEGVKSAASEVSEKANRVVDAARKGMSERTGANRQ
jgi:hypothetical protein